MAIYTKPDEDFRMLAFIEIQEWIETYPNENNDMLDKSQEIILDYIAFLLKQKS